MTNDNVLKILIKLINITAKYRDVPGLKTDVDIVFGDIVRALPDEQSREIWQLLMRGSKKAEEKK
jgi:hypothetical protein